MGLIKTYMNKLDVHLRHPSIDHHLTKMEQTIKIPRKFVATFLLILASICAIIGYLNQLTMIIGFLYPAYKSIKAIEDESNTKADRRWLIYWVVYSSMIIFEFFGDLILFWVPFYYTIKAGILIFCMHPDYEGSQFIYNRVIRPIFLTHETKIDQFVDDVHSKSNKYVENLQKNIIGEAGELADEIMNDEEVKKLSAKGLASAAQSAMEGVLGSQEREKEGKKVE